MHLHNGIAILEHDTHISKWVIEHNRLDFDQNVLPFVLSYLKNGDTIIDVGANIGTYTFAFLNKIGPSGSAHCFEPSQESYECLEHNLKDFKNAFTYNKALSDYEGYVSVIRENDNVGMNFCNKETVGNIIALTIDSLNLKRCDFIKLDCEGMELDVLNGAQKTITQFKPILFIEINMHTLKRKGLIPEDIFKFLDKYRYSYNNVYTGQSMRGEQYDIIAK